MESVTLSMESVSLHEKCYLVSMDNVDPCMKNEIRCPCMMLPVQSETFSVTTVHEKLIPLYIYSFSKLV